MNNITLPNILEIIENNNIDNEYTVLREIEETIIDLYDKKSSSELFKNDFLLLIKLDKELSEKLHIKLYEPLNLSVNLQDIINKNIDNIVITGPYIRSIFVEDKLDLKKEIYLNCIKNCDPNSLVDDTFKDINDLFFKECSDFVIYIPKKIYKNQSEVIMSNYNLKRVGLYKNELYVSPMFVSDYIKFTDSINSNMKDPVLGTRLDIFDVYHHKDIRRNLNIFDVINKKNYDEYIKFKSSDLIDVVDFNKNSKSYGLNPMEHALNIYKLEQNDIIRAQLKLIALDLSSMTYTRNPCFFRGYDRYSGD